MSSPLQHSLAVLAGHAIGARPDAWSATWFAEHYAALCQEHLFLPPLLAYELHSAIDSGDRRPGAASAARPEREAWAEFLDCLRGMSQPGVSQARRGQSPRRRRVAARLCRLFAQRLLTRDEFAGWTALRTGGFLVPDELLRLEAGRLGGVASNPAVSACWEWLDAAAARRELDRLVPHAEILALAAGVEADPFLDGLFSGTGTPATTTEPPVRGTAPRADNPRRILWPTGDFAKRDLGQLPDELGRLAPSELVLMQGLGRPDHAARPLQTLFLQRLSQGRLLQRYSDHQRHAFMEPAGRFQVELVTRIDDHRLPPPPCLPAVSWYRAVAVQLFHQFACLRLQFRWSMDYVLACSHAGRTSLSVLTEAAALDLAESPESARRILTELNPHAFSSGWPGPGGASPPPAARPQEMDVHIRITLGRSRLEPSAGPAVRAAVPLAVRAERAENGLWQLISAPEECSGPAAARTTAHRGASRQFPAGALPLNDSRPQFEQEDEDPATAADTILNRVLWPLTNPAGMP
jgi:hypothetical protein